MIVAVVVVVATHHRDVSGVLLFTEGWSWLLLSLTPMCVELFFASFGVSFIEVVVSEARASYSTVLIYK